MNRARHPCHVLGVCQGGPLQPGCTCCADARPYAPGVLQRYPLRRRTRVLHALRNAAMALALLALLALASGLLGYLLG